MFTSYGNLHDFLTPSLEWKISRSIYLSSSKHENRQQLACENRQTDTTAEYVLSLVMFTSLAS
ncbi:hypothetical protein T01_536 [Trichinella spiralis]|uniref:Uncharacterized protein n=1 Tax=Trichinella spiralis TaxID=6334 RepID=A0A0V1APF0_TRISP|nr:hypothetical protein T01_11758 [Trichinella spiralis]KRY29684.1 hypothetical protein T01_536 [Trichinella spiralis]